MPDPSDKRKHPRFEVIFKVEYEEAEDFLADHASNASTGGVFIATSKAFEIGEELTFSISFPGLLSPMLCRGKVCWRRTPEEATEEDPAGIGVAFMFESDEQEKQIRELVEKLSEPEPLDEEPAPFRVFLAEDDQQIRDAYQAALRAFHNLSQNSARKLEVIEAESGQKAWECIQAESSEQTAGPDFDLAIIKLHMPEVSGEKLIQFIRENESIGVLPVIATSRDSEEDRKMAYEAGADLFLAQPIMMGKFFESLQRFLCL